ncbi:MAG: hypothetical protein ACLP1Y_17110 [Candidatus Acidiferrales bacterium]
MLTGIVKFPLTVGQWTSIVPPFDCSYYMIIGNEDSNGNRLDIPVLRSSGQTAGTQYTMKQNDWIGVVVPARFGAYRYTQGMPVTYLQAIGEPCTAIVEFFQ